ncbi:cytochrome c-type biogenesis protein [Gilvimarinus polysaccharolyticus]|uniref:cytochrome c-type biogenesis protein n=1 Tax=Gilvimarinus polysaccharolyticus TaxID=863921 RepID=UPI000673C3EB|nr:cytochrome c-type biogenesis protein [Gilvimarinus polysaccharolyticus]
MHKLLILLLIFFTSVCSAEAIYQFDNKVDEARFKAFTEELRCPTCQSQNLAGSDAMIAQDLRRDIYEQIQDGRSDKEITDNMVARYGDYILYRPPLTGATFALWVTPFVLLIIAIISIILLVRRRRAEQLEQPLDPLEQAQLQRLIDSKATNAGSSPQEQPNE